MKILLIDDHKLFSQSIKMILELSDEVECVDVLDGIQSVDDIAVDYYDILLIDINLTSIYQDDGLALAKEIIDSHPNVKIVILTGYSKRIYEYRAKVMGTSGFLDKSIDPDDLIKKLVRVNQGDKIFSNEEILDILTPREVEILNLVRNGQTIDEICSKIYLSKRTISNHLGSIFSKLAVSNRQEAIHKAEQLGYFSPD